MPVELLIGHPAHYDLPQPQAQDADALSRRSNSWTRADHLFNNELLSDGVFLVEGKRVPVHSLLLRSSSSVFDRMFSMTWRKDKDPITLKDKYVPFMSLIRWIYTSQLVCESEDQLLDVLRLASKCMVHSLIDYVQRVGRQSHRWTLMSHALEHNDIYCASLLWKTVVNNTSQLVTEKDFLSSTPALVAELVTENALQVDEIDLFEACYKWSEAECKRQQLDVTNGNRRKIMDPFISHFAFQTMDYKDFAGHACDLLFPEEQAVIFRRIAGQEVITHFRTKRLKEVGETSEKRRKRVRLE